VETAEGAPSRGLLSPARSMSEGKESLSGSDERVELLGITPFFFLPLLPSLALSSAKNPLDTAPNGRRAL